MSDRINCRNCIHFNDLEHRCCLNDGNAIKKECYFRLSKRKPKGKDIVIENLKTKIADLEAKLAESEKKFNVANNLRKNSDEVLLNYKTEKYGLDKTIQELRKMKLSLPEKEWYYKGFENCERQMSSHIADLTLEVKQLKQQLTDKEKEIESYKDNWNILCDYLGENIAKNYSKDYEIIYSEVLKKVNELKRYDYERYQDKISFALERLEKVLNLVDGRTYVAQYLKDQIKQLKEGK